MAHSQSSLPDDDQETPKILYKYTDMEAAFKIFSNGKLNWNSPLTFNDPFDTQWDFLWQLKTQDARESEKELIRNALTDPSTWPDNASPEATTAHGKKAALLLRLNGDEREHTLDEMVKQMTDERLRTPQYDRVASGYRMRLRAFCMSSDKYSMPMWSHYGDQHRGVVVGFSTQMLRSAMVEEDMSFVKMEYQKELPKVLDDVGRWLHETFFGIDHPDADAKVLLRYKEEKWEYESEWRAIFMEEKGTPGMKKVVRIPPNSIESLTFGCRCDLHEAKKIVTLARAHSAKFATTVLSPHPTKLSFDERGFP